jgi:nucleotide-binding universal stress UspA family protein
VSSPFDVDATAVGPTLVVGHGRDPSSDQALLAAVDLGRRLGGRLHVVHVIDLHDYPINIDSPDWEEQGAAAVAAEQRHVEHLLGEAPVAWTYEARHGDPAQVLCTAAQELDALLIVVGSRGEGLRRALGRLMDPSISHAVIQRRRRPVLVVPTHD